MRHGAAAWWMVGLLVFGCSDVLGLDDMSVQPAASSAGGADACSACSETSCVDACNAADDVAGCYAFLQCVQTEGCTDQACAVQCLTANPAGQVAVECICSECAAECVEFCPEVGAGGSAATGGSMATGGGGGS